MMLEQFGCQVDVFSDGQELLSKIHELSVYDIIFMDIGLPDISGFELSSRLREVEAIKHRPIIAMTAHILERDRQQAFASGMNRIIAKPISIDDIRMVLMENC